MKVSQFAGHFARPLLFLTCALILEGCKLEAQQKSANESQTSSTSSTSESSYPHHPQPYRDGGSYVDDLGERLRQSKELERVAAVLQGVISATRSLYDHVAALSANLSALSTDLNKAKAKAGSVVVHYGNANIPAGAQSLGATALYSGKGFGSYWGHARGKEAECLQGGNAGESWAGSYSDVIYPMVTGEEIYLPSEIPALKVVSCSVFYIPSAVTFVVKGSDACPADWSKLYGGYLLGGHYNHSGGIPSSVCVDTTDFDSSMSYASPGYYSPLYGVQVSEGASQLTSSYTQDTFVKCAVCAKN